MDSSSTFSSSDTASGTLATSVDLDDEPTKLLDFTCWELAKSGVVSNTEELIALSDNCFILNPSNHLRPIYQAIPPTHPQLAIFERDALTLTNKLAQNPLVISTVTASMYYPRPSGMWGFGEKHLPVEPVPFPVLCLSINNEKFFNCALQQTSVPIHLDISSHPIQLLAMTSSVDRVLGPLFPGDALVGEGGRGTFGAYLYPMHPPSEEKVVWGLTCGHVASSHEVTSYLHKGLSSLSVLKIQPLSSETVMEYKKRRTEFIAEIDASHHNQALYSHSVQMIDAILSDDIYNDFDAQQLILESLHDEASYRPRTKAIFDRQSNDLEECKKRRMELEYIKDNISLARVGTVFCGEFGYVPESPVLLPVATSDPGFQSQQMEILESSCSEPTIAKLKVKSMISTDWLLVKVERPAEMGHSQWRARPGDIVPGLSVTFMSSNHNHHLNPQRKGTVNGMKVYIADHSIITSEWVVFPRVFGWSFAERGDSGGVIINSRDSSPIALIVAGHPTVGYAFVKPLKFVLDRVELLTGMRMEFQPPSAWTGPSAS